MKGNRLNLRNFNGDYYVGLDIGTNSVGWAVTDSTFNLLKTKGKHTWGSRLFENSETASIRRGFRGLRRRYVRRHIRLNTLKELMAPFVCDDNFFIRLNESFYQIKDRSLKNKNILFDDISFDDATYSKLYPTIYHLRNKIITKPDKQFDPKLIYLAIHHILKYRGNFLYNNLEEANIENIINKLNDVINTFNDMGYTINLQPDVNVLSVLFDTNLKSKDKVKQLKTDDVSEQFVKLLVGQKACINKLFEGADFEKDDLKLSNDDVEESILKFGDFSDVLFELLSLYNMIQYKKIMGDFTTLSEVMIDRYNLYNKQLDMLKNKENGVLRCYLPKSEYDSYFNDLDKKDSNYALYTTRGGECSYDSFKSALIKKLSVIKNSNLNNVELQQRIKNIESDLEEDKFLRKLRISGNGNFPMQVNRIELVKIIDNQGKFYPYLLEIKDKILKLFDFRINYFVGPLAKRSDKDFGWVIKTDAYKDKTITAFNYNEAVDFAKCQTEFISRMTRDCTYIIGEKSLPANSLYYTQYKVLDEVNNLRYVLNGKTYSIPLNVRDRILSRLKETNVVKKKDIQHYLLQEIGEECEVKMSGDKLNNNLKPYRDFKEIFGYVNSSNIDMLEDVIKWITVFDESKQSIEQMIKEKYADRINQTQINKILKLKYNGWGNLSKKLLVDIKTYYKQEHYSILDLMNIPFNKEGNSFKNFVSIYYDERFDFKDQVDDINNKLNITPNEIVQKLVCSPSIKRGILQSLKIVDEIIKTANKPPKQIFIEFAREEQTKGEKGKKHSRQNQLKDLYQTIKKNHSELLDAISSEDIDFLNNPNNESVFDDEKFFLYFMQMGKCAYSGVSLDLNNLSSYEVDHIIPRSLIKDDSLDNKVLVIGKENQKKKDSLVVPEEIRKKMRPLWEMWYRISSSSKDNLKFFTAEKYSRLIREDFDKNDIERFINRQIVETRQITKNFANILNSYLKNNNYDTEVRPVRAQLNHDFREAFEYYKGVGARELNDFHHAQDAYISIFTGKFTELNFPASTNVYLKFHTQWGKSHQPFKYGFVLKTLKDLDSTWGNTNFTNRQALENFDKNYYYTDIFFTKMTTTSLSGELFDSTRYKNVSNTIKFNTSKMTLIPLKKSKFNSGFLSTNDYGGYSSEKPAYYALLSVTKKKSVQVKLSNVPIRLTILNDEQKIIDYLKSKFNADDIKILKILPKNQVFISNIGYHAITGEKDVFPMNQLVFGRKYKQLYKFISLIYENDFKKWLNDNKEPMTQIQREEFFESNYKLFESVYKHHIYTYFVKDKTSYEKIENGFEEYKEKPMEDKIYFIKQLLIITHCNTKRCNDGKLNRRLVGLPTDYSLASLIYQSATGMHTKVVKVKDLLKG